MMMMVSFWLAFCAGLPESVTFTVIGEDPALVGVPLTVHPVSVSPAGSEPVIEHEYGVVPPLAVIVPEYGAPTVPFGRPPEMERGAGAIMIVLFWVAFCAGLPESVTFTVTGDEPAAVGVPLTVHPESDKPAGKVPVIEHEYAGVPLLAVIGAL